MHSDWSIEGRELLQNLLECSPDHQQNAQDIGEGAWRGIMGRLDGARDGAEGYVCLCLTTRKVGNSNAE